MFTKYITFINNSLFNHTGVVFVTYYDPKHNAFTACEPDSRVPKRYVETPYNRAVNAPAMRRFWGLLDPESRSLAESFDEKHGFFQFMRDTGLIEYYDKAYAEAAEEIIRKWEHDNHLDIDWNNIVTDW